MNIIDQILQHKEDIVAFAGTAHMVLIHGYNYVVERGGLRKMWADFLGPKQSQPSAPKPASTDAPKGQ